MQTTAPVAPQPQPPQPQPPKPPPPPLAADQPPPPLPPPLTAEQQQQQHKEILARDLQERDRLFWELLHDFVDTYHQQQLHQQQQQQQQHQHDQLPPVPATAELVGDGVRGRRQRQLWDLPVGLQPTVVIFGSAKFATASKGSAASPPRQIRADLEASDFCAFLLANERLTSTVRLQRSPAPCSVPAPFLTHDQSNACGWAPGPAGDISFPCVVHSQLCPVRSCGGQRLGVLESRAGVWTLKCCSRCGRIFCRDAGVAGTWRPHPPCAGLMRATRACMGCSLARSRLIARVRVLMHDGRIQHFRCRCHRRPCTRLAQHRAARRRAHGHRLPEARYGGAWPVGRSWPPDP